MATFGKIDEFQPDRETLSVSVKRFELFAAANNVAEARKVPLFLTVLGGSTYSLLHNLFAPENPKDKSYADIVAKLKSHYEPEPLIIAQRFHFHRRNQGPEESIAYYVAELRRLASRCKFDAYLDEALRDWLVCGLRSDAIQKRVRTEASPTLARVLEIAQGMEAAHRDAEALQQTDSTAPIGKIGPQPATRQADPTSKGKPCYRCGKGGHSPRSCVHRETVCHSCQRRGQLARVCKSRGKTQWIDSDTTKPDVISHVSRVESSPYQVVIEIEGQPVTMEVDTGAAVSLIPQSLQRAMFPQAQLSKATLNLHTYTAQPIHVVGWMSVQERDQGYEGEHKLYVVDRHC